MPITLPKLDNRTFDDLLEEGLEIIRHQAPQWTNHNDSDPGITLVQLFAYLAEMLIYRLDKVTDRNVEVFLKLLNGPTWQADSTRPLGEQVRATITELRKISRAVTGEDFEHLVLDRFGARVARAHAIPRANLEKDTAATVVVKKADDTFADYTEQAAGAGLADLPLFDSINDRLYIGASQSYEGTFRGIRFGFARAADAPYLLAYRYLNKDGKWIEIDERARRMTDYTNGFKDSVWKNKDGIEDRSKSGLIAFAIPGDWGKAALPEWENSEVTRYWIEISSAQIPSPQASAAAISIEMDESSHVSVVIIEAGPTDFILRAQVAACLNQHRLLTTRVHVVEPGWRTLRVKAKLYLKRDAKERHVEDEATRQLISFFDPLKGGTSGTGWPLGRSVYGSEVYDLLDRVPGVDYVTGVAFEAGGSAGLTEVALAANELVQFTPNSGDLGAVSPLFGEENK
jgi:hypothetical protein